MATSINQLKQLASQLDVEEEQRAANVLRKQARSATTVLQTCKNRRLLAIQVLHIAALTWRFAHADPQA
jgi:hypothetical protein